ncbi:Efflux pump roqT [Trichoderma lentiforme]|uniref:Efflux pump roqT n=1 Tax=Trichoderma lentiforme TaxID=1567552 RepID=A0A9P5C708_9HYPO|nr:Efflux pump roqT [Trichoderma lentiforme]
MECPKEETMEAKSPTLENAPTEEDSKYPRGMPLFLNLLSIILATIVCGYDANCVTTIIPVVTDRFNSLNDVGWYGTAFLLASASSQLFYGKLYLFYPAKIVFSTVVFTFAMGSLICAVAPNSSSFIVGRAISGLGSAGILAGTNIIISRCVPVRMRPIYSSIIGSIECVAISIGPLLGGAIAETLGWRWCFWLLLPLAGLTIIITIIFLGNEEGAAQPTLTLKEKIRRLDASSLAMFIPAIVCLILGLQWGGTSYPWSNWRVFVLFIISGCFLFAFGVNQYRKGEEATVPPRIFLTRTVLFGSLYSFNTSGALYVAVYYLPIWFQAVKGASPFGSGVRGLPLVLSLVVSILTSGSITSIIGYYTPTMCLGSILMAVGAGMLTTFRVDTPITLWIIYQIILALGIGLGFQQPIIATQTNFSGKDLPIALVLVSFIQNLGGIVALSSAQNIFTNQLMYNIHKAAPNIDPKLVQKVGVLSLKLSFTKKELNEILPAYNLSITQALLVATVMTSVTAIGCFGVPFYSVKGKNTKEDRV